MEHRMRKEAKKKQQSMTCTQNLARAEYLEGTWYNHLINVEFFQGNEIRHQQLHKPFAVYMYIAFFPYIIYFRCVWYAHISNISHTTKVRMLSVSVLLLRLTHQKLIVAPHHVLYDILLRFLIFFFVFIKRCYRKR